MDIPRDMVLTNEHTMSLSMLKNGSSSLWCLIEKVRVVNDPNFDFEFSIQVFRVKKNQVTLKFEWNRLITKEPVTEHNIGFFFVDSQAYSISEQEDNLHRPKNPSVTFRERGKTRAEVLPVTLKHLGRVKIGPVETFFWRIEVDLY